ncbi:hypothetical protein GS582_14450 [Rhodococcus hoagii]|nr:hypothetical protein [Prescottella equi]
MFSLTSCAEGASPEERAEQVEAIQDALDFGAGPELDDWWARGRAAFDAATPMDLPTPETDPGLAAALGSCVAAVPGKS